MKQQHAFTRHGVRDLNGPNMDGKYNGRRFKNCGHHRNPSMATYVDERVMPVVELIEGTEVTTDKKVRCHVCITCGEVRFTDADGDA